MKHVPRHKSNNYVMDLDEVCRVIRKTCPQHPEIEKVAVFGSFSRGEENENSDVDLLVAFSPEASYSERMDFGDQLADAFGRDVDCISCLYGASARFVSEVKRDGVIVYER